MEQSQYNSCALCLLMESANTPQSCRWHQRVVGGESRPHHLAPNHQRSSDRDRNHQRCPASARNHEEGIQQMENHLGPDHIHEWGLSLGQEIDGSARKLPLDQRSGDRLEESSGPAHHIAGIRRLAKLERSRELLALEANRCCQTVQ